MNPLTRLRLSVFALTFPLLAAAFTVSIQTNRLWHLAWGFALAGLATWLLNRRHTNRHPRNRPPRNRRHGNPRGSKESLS